MNNSDPSLKSLSVEMIEKSPEINAWLTQFNSDDRPIAKTMLSRLVFVTRDTYSRFIREALEDLWTGDITALYSVRKLESCEPNDLDDANCLKFWEPDGSPVVRPGVSLGSEDLVYSLISNIVRNNDQFLDHPSLDELQDKKIRQYYLIDDSIGSGDRVSEFINAMLNHPTFFSWWSFGWVKITVISFSSTRESKNNIINKIKGSNHSTRKYPTACKIYFHSRYEYNQNYLEFRWGEQYQVIRQLCDSITKVARFSRLGYGDVLSNLVFYHSVPNNIPGVLWFTNKRWNGLMPRRKFPTWLERLLDSNISQNNFLELSTELYQLLKLVKSGIRRTSSLSLRLNLDNSYTRDLIEHAIKIGLLTPETRLTKIGRDKLFEYQKDIELSSWNNSLYIPSSWCAD